MSMLKTKQQSGKIDRNDPFYKDIEFLVKTINDQLKKLKKEDPELYKAYVNSLNT